MSFISDLEQYIRKYNELLNTHDFKVTKKKDGPGMGAILQLSNGSMTIDLINDKGQFFLQLAKDNKSVDLSLLLSFIKLEYDNRDLRLMTFEEKTSIWEINYDYLDPMDSLFRNFEKLAGFLSRITADDLKEMEHEYYKDRGKWLFG